MSKARELLKKCLGTFQTINVWDDCLIKEIIELLAQPDPLSTLIEVRDIQGRPGKFDQDDYMLGLYNGLELAVSILEDNRNPKYRRLITQVQEHTSIPKYINGPLIATCNTIPYNISDYWGKGGI